MSLSEETTSQSIKMLQIYVNILIWLGLGHETIVILYSHLINLIFTPYLAHHMLRRNNNYKTIEYDLDICLGVISGKHVLLFILLQYQSPVMHVGLLSKTSQWLAVVLSHDQKPVYKIPVE